MNVGDKVFYVAWRSNGGEIPATELAQTSVPKRSTDAEKLEAIRAMQRECSKHASAP